MEKPWQVFRYRAVNEFLLKELEYSQFYCGAPSNLNDPFDCRIDWRAALEQAAYNATPDRRRKLSIIQEQLERSDPTSTAGVCCFTCKLDDTLMWSHYADGHRGVCLLYEIPSDYFMKKYSPQSDDEFFFVGGAPVVYRSDGFYDWLTGGDLDAPHNGSPDENALTVLFTTKGERWKYEEEFRLVMRRPGLIQFEPTFLKQVAFGLASSNEDRAKVTSLAQAANPSVELLQCTKSNSGSAELSFASAASA